MPSSKKSNKEGSFLATGVGAGEGAFGIDFLVGARPPAETDPRFDAFDVSTITSAGGGSEFPLNFLSSHLSRIKFFMSRTFQSSRDLPRI